MNDLLKMRDVDNEGSSGNSRNTVDRDVKETVIVIRLEEDRNEDKFKNIGKVVENKDKLKMKDLSCVIDVKSSGGGGGEEFERICRICQLSREEVLEKEKGSGTCVKEVNLIQLGCGCKDGMSFAHSQCAVTWFSVKGNRVCEICGEVANNITGIRDLRFMEECDEARLSSSQASEECWKRKSFCNFLMACLVLAFILPWFLHVTWPF